MPENKEEPELVVDTDWKSQVEKEKGGVPVADQAAATDETPVPDQAAVLDQAPDQAAVPDEALDDPTGDLPPASLAMLISTFYSQAMMALGVMENPATGKKGTDLRVAKHFIDTLEMMEEKTKGNTDKDEDKMFEEVLHLLRMAYVGAKKSK